MSRPRVTFGVLPDDLYVQIEPWPRIGRPPKHDLSAWTVTDDWPERVPVTEAEVDVFEAWFGDLFDELFGPSPMIVSGDLPMTVPLRAALYLRVSTARQAEHDVSIPDQKRQGEAYCAVARLPARRDLCRAGRVRHQRPPPRIPAHDRGGHEQARAVRRRDRPFVQPLLPRPFRTRVLRPQAREERRQAGLDHPGNGRRSRCTS